MKLETLHKYHEEGWLIKQSHPTLPLTIWNYSPATQYAGKWDEVTLRCRGLITEDITERILIQPFNKFFNYEELIGKEQIPTKGDYVYVQEKMDGSLGILFYYNGWVMATRGSFTSDQAIKGLEIVKSKYFLDSWMKEYAYLVEIIYPENRIVVDYGKAERVVFLSAVLNEGYRWDPCDDTELHWTTANAIFKANGIKQKDIVKTEQHFNFSEDLYRKLKDLNSENSEGFVLRYQPGNFRMKIKFEEYVRLHRIVTGVSTTTIWETLSTDGSFDEILANTPDEFNNWIRATRDELEKAFKSIEDEYHWIFNVILRSAGAKERKEFAELAKQYKHPSILFNMLDEKDYKSTIWKIVKPAYAKPVWTKSDLLGEE
jgi:RNA ligase